MKTIASALLSLTTIICLTACAQKPRKILAHPDVKDLSKYSLATFAAGCFWHEEALFESIKGVQEAVSGYAGGTTKNPSYESMAGHAETVNVYYDSSVISYPTLLKVYFTGQDPTQVNGQGPDLGTHYRSIVFYRNNTERQLIDNYMKTIQPQYRKPLAVQMMPFTKFWSAEDHHQNYIELNPGSGYVQSVSIPEIKHVQKEYPQLVKPDHVF